MPSITIIITLMDSLEKKRRRRRRTAPLWKEGKVVILFLPALLYRLFRRDTELTQRFTWRDISFSTPRDWFLASVGDKFEMVSRTQASHLYFSRRFQAVELTVGVRDLSYLRPLLSADSVLDFDTFLYRPDERPVSDITTFDLNGIDAASVDMLDEDGLTVEGKAVLLLTPRHAYLVVGFADPEPWAESEGDLFEAILETVVIE